MAFISQLLDFDRTDSNVIFSIVWGSYFYNIQFQSNSYLSYKTKRKNCWKESWLLRLGGNLAFWITRTTCMQSKNGLTNLPNRPRRIALLNVYKNPGPNRSGISDLRQSSKQLKFESLKTENFNFRVNCVSMSNELLEGDWLLCCRSLLCILNGRKYTDSEWKSFSIFSWLKF